MLKTDHNLTNTSMSNKSPTHTSANKYKPPQEVTLKDSVHALSQEMQNHFKHSQKQTFNDAFHDMIKNIHKEEKDQLKQAQHSILDLDIVTGKSTQKYEKTKNHSHRGHSAKNKKNKSDLYHKGYKAIRISNNTSFESQDPDNRNKKLNFYEREMARLHKKQYDIDAMRNHLRAEEKENLKEKPTLNKKTKKLIEETMNKVNPIYLRTQEIIEKKNFDLENLKRAYTEMDRVETRFNKTVSNQINNTTDFINTAKNHDHDHDQDKINDFVRTQMQWQRQTDEKKERLKKEFEKKKVDNEVGMFKPKLNKISEIIVQANRENNIEIENNNMTQNINLPTHERLFNQHEGNLEKRKMMYTENLPPFVPNVNKNILTHIKSKVYTHTGGDIRNFSKGKRNNSTNANSRSVNNKNKINNSNNPNSSPSNERNINKSYIEENMTPNFESTPQNESRNVPRDSVSNRMYLKKSSWEVQVEVVNKMNNRKSTSKRKSESENINDLYKLNIGKGSAWDKQKENLIPLNPKFKSIIGNILG